MEALPREGEDRAGAENGHDSVRSWLVSGVQHVDQRRRRGRHDNTRKLLVIDPQARPTSSEGWHSTTAALQRHTVGGALKELEPEHRRVITLAYLEGNTNRQIAAALGVSVTTAKRRLLKALERLEIYISLAGAWLAAVLIFVGARVARIPADANAQRVGSSLAAGVLAAAAVGVVTFLPDTAPRGHPATPVTAAPPSFISPTALAPVIDIGAPHVSGQLSLEVKLQGAKGGPAADAGGAGVNSSSLGCHGNPTGAPPGLPVASGASGHPVGPPVSPPGRGGCPAV